MCFKGIFIYSKDIIVLVKIMSTESWFAMFAFSYF